VAKPVHKYNDLIGKGVATPLPITIIV